VLSPGFAVAVGFSHPGSGDSEQEQVVEAEGRIRCTRSVEDTGVERALEEEGKCSGAHMRCTSEHWKGGGTSSLLEVADMRRVEGGDHGMGGGRGEAMYQEQALVRKREQAQGDAGDELVGVVVVGNAVAEAGNDHIHRVDSSQIEVDHSFHIGSGEVEVHRWQVDRLVGCYNGVRGVVVAVVRCAHTGNRHDGHTEYDQRVVGSGRPGRPVAVAEVAGSGLVG
jgi:hypothetical protein